MAATTIQRYWRGYATRNALRFNRRVTQIRGRLIEANAQACESNMIGNRTDHAITTLILYKDAKRILIAVMSLGEVGLGDFEGRDGEGLLGGFSKRFFFLAFQTTARGGLRFAAKRFCSRRTP